MEGMCQEKFYKANAMPEKWRPCNYDINGTDPLGYMGHTVLMTFYSRSFPGLFKDFQQYSRSPFPHA